MNPFEKPSSLLFQAPAFDKIKETDYEPAFEAGMKAELAAAEAIATSPEPPTFENTIVALERGGEMLGRAQAVFFGMTGANTNETLQKIEARVAPKFAAHHDAMFLNAKLFARVEAVFEHRDSLDAESKVLVEKYHRNFVKSGARLSAADQEALKALNAEESSLTTKFTQTLLAANKGGALVVDNPAALAGMADSGIAAAAELAKSRKLEGKWVVPLQNTTQQPAQVHLSDRATREQLFNLSTQRAEKADANDTRPIVQRLAELRAHKAKLLGFPNYSAYALQDQMAGTPDRAEKLLSDMAPAAVAKARGEAAKMQALADKESKKGKRFDLAPWDWQYYAEEVRKAEFAIDDAQVRPYLELNRVLVDGVFFAANRLYGLTFKERHDLPVYQDDVRVFEVFDETGKSFALFYADYFKRDNKRGGAWMSSFIDQTELLGTHPVVYNVCNFTKPVKGEPALLTFDDVRTMFHEFGHALHGLLSNVKYPSLAGTSVPRDFVEFPSQFNEHWAAEPSVFANYAKHYKTGEPMPAELVAKVEKARKFNQGYATTEYLAAALLDIAWHTLPEGTPKKDVDAFEAEALKRFNVDFRMVPPRYRTSYFEHIWGGGYASSYYAYLWSEVLDHDAFEWFREHGGMTRENGRKFRDMILSRGSTMEMAALYRAFRGRDPSVEPLLEQRGLKPEKASHKAK